MEPGVFILTICAYLFSLVSALVLSFFTKHISNNVIYFFIFIHVSAGLSFLFIDMWFPDGEKFRHAGLLFLAFFCSGMLLGGMVLRKQWLLPLKIYFSIFLVSIVFFIISPARLLGFISSGNIHSINPKRFHLQENYYFVEQELGKNESGDSILYKLVMEMGVFHKTMARDIYLPSTTDSLKNRKFEKGQVAEIMVYFRKPDKIDSLKLKIPLNIHRDSSKIITRKP